MKVFLCMMQRHVLTSNKSDSQKVITCQSSQNTILSYLKKKNKKF